MSEHKLLEPPIDEGGLSAPPGLSFWGKAWWWFDFIILVKLARLRFVAVLVAIGVVITQWDSLIAYYEKWTRSPGDALQVAGDVEWFCPMHPTVVRDNSREKCPVCFMPLSKRKKGESSDTPLPAGVVSRVQLSPYRIVLAGVQTWPVDFVPLTKTLTTVGFIEFNERGFKTVSARVKGRLDQVIAAETGRQVNEGDELAAIYSPELNVTVQTLLDAHKKNLTDLLKSSRQRLQLLGISDDQIDNILKTGTANSHLRIRSPLSGHIVKKYVREGQYVEEGTPLYDVVDLTTVWLQAQVFEDDLSLLPSHNQHGDVRSDQLAVTALTRAFPNEPFRGVLSFVFPHVDPDSRTATVRFEIDNPDHKLRPGTSATVRIDLPFVVPRSGGTNAPSRDDVDGLKAELPTAERRIAKHLAVPEGSVIDTGQQKIVYREAEPGVFEGVLVELGPKLLGPDDVTFYPVLKGLEQGERIVTSGSFLVDAETRLNPAAGSIYIGGSSGGKETTPSTVRPSTPEDTDAKIDLALNKLDPKDRELAKAQKFCPILAESRLGSMGAPVKVLLEGQPVFLCCPGCQSKAKKNPAATLEIVKKLTARH